ncbi:hypothetical protein AGDE_13892 [Angomonas deanei]|nr:hypothetical protein AGDE_13892 [Angomonas deanei]|eukprot:EPY21653.1 hypothetical protein AGDE_13892 [Angomonas deanei]
MEGETHEPTQSIAPECPESLRLFAVQLTDGGQPLCLTPETKLSEVTAHTDVLRLGDEADSPVVLLYADEESMGDDAFGIALLVMCAVSLVCMLVACLTPICAECCAAQKEKKEAKKRKKQEQQIQQQQQNQSPQQYYNYAGGQPQQQPIPYGAPPPAGPVYYPPAAEPIYGQPVYGQPVQYANAPAAYGVSYNYQTNHANYPNAQYGNTTPPAPNLLPAPI